MKLPEWTDGDTQVLKIFLFVLLGIPIFFLVLLGGFSILGGIVVILKVICQGLFYWHIL